jgi:hypothetical protein
VSAEDRNSKIEIRKAKGEIPVILSEAKNLRSSKVQKQLPGFFAALRMTTAKPTSLAAA